MMQFADTINLQVRKPTSSLSELEAYLINSIVREWKHSWDRITNTSAAGNHRLEQYLSDHELTRELMSDKLRNQTIPWGMISYARQQSNT